LSPFVPVFFACLAGPVLQLLVSTGVRLARPRAADRRSVDRTTDRICVVAAVAALVVVCATGTPAVWEITFLFSFLWPVLLRQILRVSGQRDPST